MPSKSWMTFAAAAAAGGVGEFVRRRRSPKNAPLPTPPVTTQSSPGQIADLQQAYGAEMAPPAVLPPAVGSGRG